MRNLAAALGGMLFISSMALAQATPTPAPSTTASDTNVNYFFVVCEDRAVLDLDGTIQRNYDIYVQVFRDAGGLGTPLTPQLRIAVDGSFQVSPPLTFNVNEKLLLGQFGSAKLTIARESDPTNILFETPVDDVQDGCATPSFPATPVTATGVAQTTGAGTQIVDPLTGQLRQALPGEVIADAGIFRPDGGMLNQVFARPQEQIVQIGRRTSEDDRERGRTSNPGLIFAECDQFPKANPGRLFDTDRLVIFWSWFAKTPEQVLDHVAKAQYNVRLGDYGFPKVQVSEIRQLSDGNYWVFYTADLGDRFRPGRYNIFFELDWREATFDGFDDYGPGTTNERVRSTCTFDIEANPYNLKVEHINPTFPLQQHLP